MTNNSELEVLGAELAAGALREHHRELANDHRHLVEAGLTTALNVSTPDGSMTFAALSDPEQVFPIDVLNVGMTCTTSATSEGDGPFTVQSYTLRRGSYAAPGKPVVTVDVTGALDADNAHVWTPVVPGVLGYTAWAVGHLDTTTEEFDFLVQELHSAPPPAAPGTAVLYTVTTVTAYHASVTYAVNYTGTDGDGHVVYAAHPVAQVLNKLDTDEDAFAQFLLGVGPLQQDVREAVETVTATPALP